MTFILLITITAVYLNSVTDYIFKVIWPDSSQLNETRTSTKLLQVSIALHSVFIKPE